MSKVVWGWGVDGFTTFQKGFPLPVRYGASTPLSSPNLGIGVLRPNYVPGCDKTVPHTSLSGAIAWLDRKSLRLNSSHQIISYAVFCLNNKYPTRVFYAAHPGTRAP